MKILFIGIGNMGLPMAHNLSKTELELEVFDLSSQAMSQASALGLKSPSNLEESLGCADVIISMLPASQHVETLYTDKVFAKANPNCFLIDCSTIAPTIARKVAKLADEKSFAMVDAPVSGGTAAATAGTLTFMVGGDSKNFLRAKPILEKMGKKIFHAGPAGCGQVAKVCNNMLLAIHMIGTSEALVMGKNLGLDPKVLSEIMSQSSGRNWSLEIYNPYPGVAEGVPASRDYAGGFGVRLMCKDLGLAAESATASKSLTPLGDLARKLYTSHSEQGWAEKDFSSILKTIEKGTE